MNLSLALSLAVSLLVAADAPKKKAADDVGKLQGTWKLVSGEVEGKPMAAKEIDGAKLVLKNDGYVFSLAGKEPLTGTQKLDPRKKPKTIDITESSGPNKGKTCLGIYEIKGDEFRVVFAQPGKPRPTKFSTAEGSDQWMHVWKRAKK